MAFLLNPNYGQPGAPRGLNWWDNGATPGSVFRMSDLLSALPPPAPFSPPPPPQPLVIYDQPGTMAEPNTDTGGGEGGTTGAARGGTGSFNQQETASGQLGLRDPFARASTTAPKDFNSQYGLIGGTLGGVASTAAGIPGLGMLGGLIGENVDLANYAANLRAHGIPFTPDYLSASLAGVSSLPLGLGSLFGTGARAQSENARRDAIAGTWGNHPGGYAGDLWGENLSQPSLPANTDLLAAAGILPDAVPARVDANGVAYYDLPVAAFDPATLGREYGYGAAGTGSMGAPPGETGYASGTYASAMGLGESGSGVGASQGGSDPVDRGGGMVDTGRDYGADPGRDFGFFKGGLIGPPRAAPGLAPDMAAARPGLPIDPPGPDDTVIPAQVGEGVLNKQAMAAYPGLLEAANAGKLDPAKLGGLLTPRRKGRGRA